MLNSQLNDFASAAHLTQVASYFDIVDNAVKTGDTNKRYNLGQISILPQQQIICVIYTIPSLN